VDVKDILWLCMRVFLDIHGFSNKLICHDNHEGVSNTQKMFLFQFSGRTQLPLAQGVKT
jgi:hypothetical protein